MLAAPAQPSSTASAVVNAARDRFFSFGFRAVKLDDLAADLGMRKKTLDAHFRSKREPLAEINAVRREERLPRHFGKLFEQGRREGLIRKDLDGGFVIQILIIAIQAIIRPENIERLEITLAEAYRDLLTVMIERILMEERRQVVI